MRGGERTQSSVHLRHLARVYSSHYSLDEALDQSLNPRGPDMLLDLAGASLGRHRRIRDIGCRDARYLIRLVQAHNCRGVGFDPLDRHVERARSAVDEAGLGEWIQITTGVIEQIAHPDDHFDFIWCRDVLELVE